MISTLGRQGIPGVRPVVEDATRREFLALLAASGLLAGCGSTGASGEASPAATGTWTRGPFGTVEVPRDPQRPDLVLDSWDTEQDRYDLFSGIAPTVNFAPVLYPDDFAATDWQAAVEALGAAFGREQAAADAAGAYRDAVGAARARLGAARDLAFAGVNVLGGDGAIVIDAGQQVSRVAADLGLRPHPLVSATPADRVTLSLEELGRLADVDVLLLAEYPAEGSLDRDSAFLDPVVQSPLWQRLPAVQGSRVVTYPGEIYYASPLTSVAMIDMLGAGLAEATR